jgi:hypothetical protein
MPDPTLYEWVGPAPQPCYPEAFIPLGHRTYPGRTDETERAFEGDTVTDRRDPRSPAFHLGTIPNPNGPGVVELDPTCCHHGHPLNPGTCTRGWQPCGGPHHGHRTWECWHAVDGQRCGDLVQWPPASDACTPISGYGTGGSP